MKHRRPSRSLGQAVVEYTIVVAMVTAALLADPDGTGSALSQVVSALKTYFGAYSWAISYSNNLTKP